MKGTTIIQGLRNRWLLVTIVSDLLIALGISWLVAAILNRAIGWSYSWAILIFLLLLGVLFFLHRQWKINENEIARMLDQSYPQLEESSTLLLRNPSALNLLESLQVNKTDAALLSVTKPLGLSRKLLPGLLVLLGSVSIALLLHTSTLLPKSNPTQTGNSISPKTAKPEVLLTQVVGIHISITPPAYTGKNNRQQELFNVTAEEGSMIEWKLRTTTAATTVLLIFNDTLKAALHATGGEKSNWQLDKKIDSTGFYQLSIDGKISELYKLEIIKDIAPVIQLASPKQYTTIDMGEPPQVKIASSITDDYGIKDASITATIASGSGEGVKFKEQKIALKGFVAGKKQYQLEQSLSLPALGMQAGDELYFYVQATDNHLQQTRSDIFIVHLPDTAQLMSLEGLGNNLNLKPEYFRSQRQIIIETEQLLKEKDTISAEAFKSRSNNLGIDQKLLRLRYSKFLGDENESGESNIDQVAGIADFSNAEKLKDAFTDKHDNAEDATFFEPGTKKQLQATLAEMWNAEIRLRTFVPQTALPFEYKALRLLKDLQQQSRAYVAKTSFKTTPLDLKKRLTGNLSKIDQPVLQKDSKPDSDPQAAVRAALSVLEQIKATGYAGNDSWVLLQQANLRLHEKAVQQPAVYLEAVEAMKKIISSNSSGEKILSSDVVKAGRGLQHLLVVPGQLPNAAKTNAAQLLSKQYFDNLQKRQP